MVFITNPFLGADLLSSRFCCKVLQKIYFSVKLRKKTEHRTVKYLNNLIEQDHRPIKRRNKFYQSLRTASSTIKGMETLRGIYKKNRRNGTLFGFSVSTEIKVLMGITA